MECFVLYLWKHEGGDFRNKETTILQLRSQYMEKSPDLSDDGLDDLLFRFLGIKIQQKSKYLALLFLMIHNCKVIVLYHIFCVINANFSKGKFCVTLK